MFKYNKVLALALYIGLSSTSANANYADDFVFPVIENEPTDASAIVHNRTNPIGDGWHGNGLGDTGSGALEGHLGQDYFLDSGSEVGKRVYAISDGVVVEAINSTKTYGWCDDTAHGWGRVIVIKHEAPPGFYFNTNGSIETLDYLQIDDRCPPLSSCALKTEEKPSVIYSLYGHLSKTDFDVAVGDTVVVGQPIAKIGDTNEQPWSPHLHLEIKSQDGFDEGVWSSTAHGTHSTPQACNAQGVGGGYSYISDYTPERYDPNTFIKQRRSMTFEGGTDGQAIKSTIPGLVFTTTAGFDWIYGDITTGLYNAKTAPDPTGPFATFGNAFAWLGPAQGLGRIDFIASTTSELSLFYSGASDVYLEAYDIGGQLVSVDSGSSNIGTGRLDKLTVSSPNIAYVLVHDTGNIWLVDNLSIADILADARTIVPFNSTLAQQTAQTINQSQTKSFNFVNNIFQSLKILLHWPGSELRIDVYNPNGDFVKTAQSTNPPLIVSIPNAEIGQWRFDITGIDVPSQDYPMALLVYIQEITNQPPVTDAGPDQSVILGSPVTLDGSASEDPDSAPSPLTYTWVQEAGPLALLSGEDTPSPSFVTTDVGTYVFTLTTSDGDLSASDSMTINVVYDFAGFFSPVENPDVWNAVKSGSSVPLKFRLNGDHGPSILKTGSPTSRNVACDNSSTSDVVEETETSGKSGLNYDLSTDTYTYVWKTSKSWKGSCRILEVELIDHTIHRALFNFSK